MTRRRHSHSEPVTSLAAVCLCVLALAKCVAFDESDSAATKAWGAPERLHDRGGFPEIAMDSKGNAIVLFGHWLTFGETSTTRAARFTPGSGWSEAEQIDLGVINGGRAGPRQIVLTPDGNAIAVWHQTVDERESIFANHYAVGSGWGTAEPIGRDGGGSARDPDVAVDAEGSALAVWHQSDGTREDVWFNRFTPTDGWGRAALVEHDDVGDALGPRIAMAPDGTATAVWHQFDGSHENVWSNRFTPGIGWGIPRTIEDMSAGDALEPKVAMDADGNAIAVWHQFDGTRFNVWSNRYDSDGGWTEAHRLEESNAGDAIDPHVAMNPKGTAAAVWQQFDGRSFGIWCSRYTPSAGWRTAEPVETHELGDSLEPRVAIDPAGNAMAVWYRNDGAHDNIWANHYRANRGWGEAQRIDHYDGGIVHQPRVAMDPDGNAIAVWLVWTDVGDGVFGLWSRRFADEKPALGN